MNTWILDPVHSEIGFKVKHLMISTVRGHFTTFQGTVTASDDTFTDAKISFTADIASISTNNEQRDGHLKSADFFDAATFPTLSFESTSVVKQDEQKFVVNGNLTIRGITKEISLNVTFNGIGRDLYGKTVASFEMTGELNRKDFGLTWNAVLETGGVAVSDMVTLDMTLEVKQGAE